MTQAASGDGGSAPAAAPPPPRIPAEALTERNARARAKGLPGTHIVGGQDPTPEVGRREERRYLRLLLVMVAAIVLAGFVFGVAGMLVGGPPPS